MFFFNSLELCRIFFKFCTSQDIKNLRNTCKYLHSLIPKDWTIEEIYILQENKSLTNFLKKTHANIFTIDDKNKFCISRFLFCGRLFITSIIDIDSIEIPLKLLQDLTIIYCPNVRKIHIYPFIMLTDVYIRNLKKCESIFIPDNNISITKISIIGTGISNFLISPRWQNLRNIILTDNENIQELVIPKTCRWVRFIDISKNRNLKNLYIYSDLEYQSVIIRCIHIDNLYIHINKKNISKIWIFSSSEYTIMEI